MPFKSFFTSPNLAKRKKEAETFIASGLPQEMAIEDFAMNVMLAKLILVDDDSKVKQTTGQDTAFVISFPESNFEIVVFPEGGIRFYNNTLGKQPKAFFREEPSIEEVADTILDSFPSNSTDASNELEAAIEICRVCRDVPFDKNPFAYCLALYQQQNPNLVALAETLSIDGEIEGLHISPLKTRKDSQFQFKSFTNTTNGLKISVFNNGYVELETHDKSPLDLNQENIAHFLTQVKRKDLEEDNDGVTVESGSKASIGEEEEEEVEDVIPALDIFNKILARDSAELGWEEGHNSIQSSLADYNMDDAATPYVDALLNVFRNNRIAPFRLLADILLSSRCQGLTVEPLKDDQQGALYAVTNDTNNYTLVVYDGGQAQIMSNIDQVFTAADGETCEPIEIFLNGVSRFGSAFEELARPSMLSDEFKSRLSQDSSEDLLAEAEISDQPLQLNASASIVFSTAEPELMLKQQTNEALFSEFVAESKDQQTSLQSTLQEAAQAGFIRPETLSITEAANYIDITLSDITITFFKRSGNIRQYKNSDLKEGITTKNYDPENDLIYSKFGFSKSRHGIKAINPNDEDVLTGNTGSDGQKLPSPSLLTKKAAGSSPSIVVKQDLVVMAPSSSNISVVDNSADQHRSEPLPNSAILSAQLPSLTISGDGQQPRPEDDTSSVGGSEGSDVASSSSAEDVPLFHIATNLANTPKAPATGFSNPPTIEILHQQRSKSSIDADGVSQTEQRPQLRGSDFLSAADTPQEQQLSGVSMSLGAAVLSAKQRPAHKAVSIFEIQPRDEGGNRFNEQQYHFGSSNRRPLDSQYSALGMGGTDPSQQSHRVQVRTFDSDEEFFSGSDEESHDSEHGATNSSAPHRQSPSFRDYAFNRSASGSMKMSTSPFENGSGDDLRANSSAQLSRRLDALDHKSSSVHLKKLLSSGAAGTNIRQRPPLRPTLSYDAFGLTRSAAGLEEEDDTSAQSSLLGEDIISFEPFNPSSFGHRRHLGDDSSEDSPVFGNYRQQYPGAGIGMAEEQFYFGTTGNDSDAELSDAAFAGLTASAAGGVMRRTSTSRNAGGRFNEFIQEDKEIILTPKEIYLGISKPSSYIHAEEALHLASSEKRILVSSFSRRGIDNLDGEWKDSDFDRANNRKTVGRYNSTEDVDNALREIILVVAKSMIKDGNNSNDALAHNLKEALRVIKIAKLEGGVAEVNKRTIQKTEASEWDKEFSKKFQEQCKKCGILSGRDRSTVGLRTAYVPSNVMEIIKEDIANKAELSSKLGTAETKVRDNKAAALTLVTEADLITR